MRPPLSRTERILRIVLRYGGTVSLLALFAVFMPYAWMNDIHQWLGMGTLPKEPIVGYVARSLSFFYAILGALMWLCSFDLPRYRAVILFLGTGFVVFGILVFGIDVIEGLPAQWKFAEGPIVTFWGIVIALLGARIRPERRQAEA